MFFFVHVVVIAESHIAEPTQVSGLQLQMTSKLDFLNMACGYIARMVIALEWTVIERSVLP